MANMTLANMNLANMTLANMTLEKMNLEMKIQMLHLNGIQNFDNITMVCYRTNSITTNGVWKGENPLDFSLPLFILQLMIIVSTTQIVVFILKPLRQPRVVCEILAGVLLGPSGFGAIDWIGRIIFPMRSVTILEAIGNIGLLYYLFLVGVEMDVSLVKQSNRHTVAIAAFGMFLPFMLFIGLSFITIMAFLTVKIDMLTIIFQSVTVSFTAYPVLSRILAELKLFNTELGKKSMSAALLVDLCAWFLIVILVGLSEIKANQGNVYLLFIGSIVFVLLCILVIRPGIIWIIKRTPEGENFHEFYICLILTGVVISSFITDAIGTHSVFGAFIFGLIIPNGALGTTLLEKLEDFVNTLLLPIFFTISGFRTNIYWCATRETFVVLKIFCTLVSNATKVFGIFLIGLYYDMQKHEALSLGLLMNTTGLIDLVFLNVSRYKNVTNRVPFTTVVLCMVIMTSIITPAIAFFYKANKRAISYKHMTIQKTKMDSELKLLICAHTLRNIPALIKLIEASNATRRSPIYVYALHLVELTGRASSMLIVHNAYKRATIQNTVGNTQMQFAHIAKAFEGYAQSMANITIQLFTAISPYHSMHEDICNLAEDKRTTLVIVPFHKQQTIDGGMESINPALRNLNQNVLANAPCSVGIFIDRGLSGSISHIAVIFIGGSDDREALAYGWRMVQQPGVNLTVMRFVPGYDMLKSSTEEPQDDETLKVNSNMETEMQHDDEYIGEFRLKTVGQETIVYKEKMVNSVEETVAFIRGMDSIYDLYIVGRGQDIEFLVMEGLNEFSENPELGAIGDMLASSDFTTAVSVLVVQQYVGEGTHEGSNKESPTESVNKFSVDV